MFEETKRLYYFTGPDHAIDNIARRHLKISFPNEVNDIFEMMPFDFGEDRATRRAWKQAIDDPFSQENGFISLTENWDSPTMWGHYAQSHKGVCYGFDIKIKGNVAKMNYEPEFKPFDTKAPSGSLGTLEAFEYALQTKSTHWEYEDEWRIILELSQEEVAQKKQGVRLFYKKFDDDLILKEVIVGAKSPIHATEIQRALADNSEVGIKKARASFRDFKIVEHLEYFKP